MDTQQMKSQDLLKKFYEEYQPPKWFKVPTNFPKARNKSVIIKKEAMGEKAMKSGIIIPESQQGINKYIGRIYACGPACENLAPGMRVFFNAYANQIILLETDNGTEEFGLMHDADVFVVLGEDEMTMTKTITAEERKQYSESEMPNSSLSPEEQKIENQMIEEQSRLAAEQMKKDNAKIFNLGDSL